MDELHSKQERAYWENIVITMLEVLIEMRLRGIFVDMEAMASFWKERKNLEKVDRLPVFCGWVRA